jgi:hypothetical protein
MENGHPMTAESPCFTELEQLSSYIYQTLCDKEQLEPGAFPMTERIIVRAEDPCGMYFCLHGPRSVKLTAIADFESESLICYGSDGTRSIEQRPAPSPWTWRGDPLRR